jgi:hypothetical protein
MINKICASQMRGACGRAGIAGSSGKVESLLKSIGIAGLVIAPAACLTATPASAQSFPGTPGELGGRTVTIEASARALYDSNVARGSSAVAGVRDLREDDITYTPAVAVNVVLPVARSAVFLRGSVGYDFHQYNTILDRERIGLSGGVASSVGPCGGTLNAGYSRQQSDQQDLELTVTKNTQEVISGGLQISCPIGPTISPFFGVQAASTENSASDGVANSDLITYSGGVSYINKLIGTLNLFASYGETSYKEPRGATIINRNSDFNNLQVGVSISRPIGARLSGRATFSYSRAEVEDDLASDTYTGFSGSGALTYRVNPRSEVTVSYERSTNPSVQEGSAYTLLSAIQVQGGYRLSNRLRASLGARWSERSYRGDIIASPTRIADEDTRSVFGSLHTTLGRDTRLTLDARYEDRNTNLTIFNYDAYQVGLTATRSF